MAQMHRVDNNLSFFQIASPLSHLALSDGALRLYTHLYSIKQNTTVNDQDLARRFKCSRTTLMRRKSELKRMGLLDILRSRKQWHMYVWCPVGSVEDYAPAYLDCPTEPVPEYLTA